MVSSENNIVVGLQWGQEGKNRLLDFFANRSEVIVRFHGSASGGHEITAGGEHFTLDYLPCGIHHAGKLCVITHGVTLDLEKTSEEIAGLTAAGVFRSRLLISPRCPLILDYHKRLDVLAGRLLGHDLNRTMEQRGYGHAVTDNVRRLGIRAGDLLAPERLRERLELNLKIKNEYFEKIYNEKPMDPAKLFTKIMKEGQRLLPYIGPVDEAVSRAVERNIGTLFAGCSGSLNDLSCGVYPYVLPGTTIAPAAFLSAGLRHSASLRIIGAAKAYCTKSGPGPFITEDKSAVAAFIRTRGSEYDKIGETPRRIGWLDLPALKYAAQINGADLLAVTKLDVLTGIDELKICTGYMIGGELRTSGDLTAEEPPAAEPVYAAFEGWRDELPGCTDFNLLPPQAQAYIRFIEDFMGLRVIWTGLGTQWGNALYRIN
ncbi:MAG: adenylosuccinate synthetase [Cloacibacillus porcorum]|uniref:adenylosuccinate synthetase n=1 Tax=Cloacibacillus porcorum TaxID=1197717 RepID=UPI0023F38276|nr:adenylosuccinate synthetase [Cloacibacillus porcorum]MCD7878177.1 adenylosuccinate synthetase [Cloacibacillus porcorum]